MIILISEKGNFTVQFITREKERSICFEDKFSHECGSVMITYAEHRRPWVGFQVLKRGRQLNEVMHGFYVPDNRDAKHKE